MARGIAQRQLYRSRDAMLAGVCAGIAERCEFDPIVIRILAILITLTTFGFGVFIYIALWVYLPRAEESRSLYDVTPERAESSAFGNLDCLKASSSQAYDRNDGASFVARLGLAVLIMLLFVAVAVGITPMVRGVSWWQFWPLVGLMAGLCLAIVPIGSSHGMAWHAAGIVLMSVAASLLPISLGVVAWDTIPFAFSHLWVFVAVAAVLFCLGYVRNINSLMIAGALCFAMFCLVSLAFYAIPGDADSLMLLMPDGRAFRIVILGG